SATDLPASNVGCLNERASRSRSPRSKSANSGTRCRSSTGASSATARILWLCGLGATRKLFDLPFCGVEPLLAQAVELLAPLPELQGLVERSLARLEPLHGPFHLLLRLLQSHFVSSTRASAPAP